MNVPNQFADWKVLIVDDEPDNVDVAAKILSFYGAEVHTATNGMEGLAVLERFYPTLILLDLSMPIMDGWEMLAALRGDERWGQVPVIALTAHAMRGDKEKVLAAGFDEYIPKPFRLTEFLIEVQRCLARIGNKLVVHK